MDRLWSEAWDREFLAGTPNKDPHAAATDAWAVMDEALSQDGGDWEDFNRLQRARREGYANRYCGNSASTIIQQDAAMAAARVFPLKKPAPRMVVDPCEASWVWRMHETGECVQVKMGPLAWSVLPEAVRFTPDRIRMLYDLIQNPWVYVDDTEPETEA